RGPSRVDRGGRRGAQVGGGDGNPGGAAGRRLRRVRGGRPEHGWVVLDLTRMDRMLEVDDESRAVHVEAGIRGDRLESALQPRGLTVGHYLQSIAISTVGGWIAASSAGQASAGFGAIEDRLLRLTAVFGSGEVVSMKPMPRSAAGPDL